MHTNRHEWFPMIGKIKMKFSNSWKIRERFFQGLENQKHHFIGLTPDP